jgi:phosphoglucosamine mutase
MLSDVTLFPQTLLNLRLQPGQAWKSPALDAMVKSIETELGQTGRVLIRPSGTEPLVRVMVEARDAQQAQTCAQRMVDAIKAG